MSSSQKPRALKGWAKIASKLNIVDEFKELGFEFPNENVSQKGYVSCWAYDRPHGDSASAGVNVKTGWYKDHGGTSQGAYLYQMRSFMGLCATSEDAVKYYAAKAGMVDQIADHLQAQVYAQDQVLDDDFNPVLAIEYFKRMPEVTQDAVRESGARHAVWPKRSPNSSTCLAIPIRDSKGSQLGWVLQSYREKHILKYKGEGVPPDFLERVVLGSSGLINDQGMNVMRAPDVEGKIILKTEGVSDMYALQSIIPEAFKHRIAVVTNACGCRDIPAHALDLFRGTPTVVIHDADVPGQEGAHEWCTTLKGFCPSVKNLVLFEEISETKGPDVRDWINGGGTFDELMELIGICPEYTVDQESLTDEQASRLSLGANATEEEVQDHILLRKLKILVLGHLEDTNRIVCYSQQQCRSFEIGQVDRYKVEMALLNMGTVVDDVISMGMEYEPDKYTMTQLRRAIARTAAKKSLRSDDRMGAGVWKIGDKIVLVNDGEISIANGDMETSRVPSIGGKVIEFASDPWYDHEEIAGYYQQTTSREWCQEVFNEASAIFQMWDNWVHPDSPFIVTAMVCASWIQTSLDFRPGVVVTGPTNSGKTFLTQETVSKMFGTQALFVTNPTEAGIRQAIGNTSKMIMIDEFESSQHRQKILEVLRSSTRGTDIVKGTSDHRGQKFHFRHIPWLSSIETGLKQAADRNRYIILELGHVAKSKGNSLVLPPVEELELIGRKLLAIGMRYHGVVRTLHADLKSTPVDGIDRRIIEAYSLPAAILGAVNGLSLVETQNLLTSMLGNRFTNESFDTESDESALLEAISMVSVRAAGAELTLGDLLTMPSYALETKFSSADLVNPTSVLAGIGVKVTNLNPGAGQTGANDGVAIATRTFSGKLKGTRFEKMNIEEILLRIPGSRTVGSGLQFGNTRLKCVVIPITSLVTEDPEAATGEASESEPKEIF